MNLFQNLDAYLEKHKHFGLLLLRIFIGCRLIYGVIDNVVSWDKMIEFSHFLNANGFPIPTPSAVISVYVQLICGMLLLIGYKTRLASFVLIINFLVALLFVHVRAGDSIEGMTPALAMLFGSAALLFTGAGKMSIEGATFK